MENTYNTTKELLLSTKLPLQSRTYKPVGHSEVIDLTITALDKAGFKLETEKYDSYKNGNVAIGKYTISNIADSEMQLQIAWLNSYDKSKRLTYGIGSQVFICQNGCISADMGAFKKKHQGEIQTFTPSFITEYVKRAQDTFEKMIKQREEMKKIDVSKRIQSELVGRMYLEEEIITSTQLNIIKDEMKKPSFDYKCEGSMWELYNHCTLALKDSHPSNWMKAHMEAHSFFVNEAGILVTPGFNASSLQPINQLELFEHNELVKI